MMFQFDDYAEKAGSMEKLNKFEAWVKGINPSSDDDPMHTDANILLTRWAAGKVIGSKVKATKIDPVSQSQVAAVHVFQIRILFSLLRLELCKFTLYILQLIDCAIATSGFLIGSMTTSNV